MLDGNKVSVLICWTTSRDILRLPHRLSRAHRLESGLLFGTRSSRIAYAAVHSRGPALGANIYPGCFGMHMKTG